MNIIEFQKYRIELIQEMMKLGATNFEIKLINDSLIKNSIKNNRDVKDVAWALMQ